MLMVKGISEGEKSFFVFQSEQRAERAPKFPFSAHSKIMAAFNEDSNVGIENLVRRIINSVREVPNTVASSSPQQSGGQGTNDLHATPATVEEELNHRFRIPRGESGQTQISLNRSNDSSNMGRQYNLRGKENPLN